jgi:hypothetical protein
MQVNCAQLDVFGHHVHHLRRVFVQDTDNVVDPPLSREAVLSQSAAEKLDDFISAEAATLDQACDHTDVADHLRGKLDFVWLDLGGHRGGQLALGRLGLALAALGVLELLLVLACLRGVAGSATLTGACSTVSLPAAKRAPQIPPRMIARVGQEEDPAISAATPNAPAKLPIGLPYGA